MFSADTVWGLAVAADRINGGYFKEDKRSSDNQCILNEANKHMVKRWLREGYFTEATEADIVKGREIRHYFKGLLFKQIKGTLNDFESNVLRIAQIDEFTGKHMIEFAMVSCLPSMMLRDKARNDLDWDIRNSSPLQGNVGDKIICDITVVKCFFSQDYNKYRITAKVVDSFVDFWYNNSMETGSVVSIKAKIKSLRDNNVTQLNFVKRA